jgi:hypothetical protein
MGWHKTSAVARLLGIPYTRLFALIRYGHLAPPPKDESGDYIWSDADVNRAREALAASLRRNAKAARAGEAAR